MQEKPLNILEFISILKKRKVIFALICIPAVSVAIIASFLMTKIYSASAVISYSSLNHGRDSSAMEKLSQIIPSIDTVSGENPGEIIKLLESKSLAEEVINKRNLLPVFFDKKNLLSFSSTKEPTIWDGIRFIQNNLSVDYDRLSGTIEITFNFRDPKVAVDIVNEYIETLNNRLKSETVSTAEKTIKSLEKQLIGIGDVFLKDRIYNMIVLKIGDIALAESQKYINFKLIDPPKVPDKKIKPKRQFIVIITFLGSFMISIFLILLVEHIERLKRTTEVHSDKDS